MSGRRSPRYSEDPRQRRSARAAARRRAGVQRRLFATGGLTIALVVAVLVVLGVTRVDAHGARTIRYAIDSRLVHQSLPQVAVVPPGTTSARRPLLVFLHGKG